MDTSGWLEYFGEGPNTKRFEDAIEDVDSLVVPSISVYECFKYMHRERDEEYALRAVTTMRRGRVVDLDEALAVRAAQASLEYGLPMADAIILATARSFGATLYTQDADFEGLPGVEYIAPN